MIDIKRLTKKIYALKIIAGQEVPRRPSIEELRCLADCEWHEQFKKNHPDWDGNTKGVYEREFAKFIKDWNVATGSLDDARAFRRSRHRVGQRPGYRPRRRPANPPAS